MKALVKSKAEPGLWMEDVPIPEIGINDVLIKVDRTGICGTDGHIWKWDEWARKTIPVGLVGGHEFVGEIVEVGSNVSGFSPGQVVYVVGFSYPVVPKGKARIRTQVSAAHTEDDLSFAMEKFSEVKAGMGI